MPNPDSAKSSPDAEKVNRYSAILEAVFFKHYKAGCKDRASAHSA
jgi:hypothetical protein